jgi:hypothetical protein
MFGWSYGGPWRWAPESQRLAPPPEAVVLDPLALGAQLRSWQALADLEAKASRSRPMDRAECLYRQAAALYHDPNVLFPVYACHAEAFASVLRRRIPEVDADTPAAAADLEDRAPDRRMARYETASLSLVRALPLFREVERDYPAYPALDRAVFSQGLAWVRLASYRPFLGLQGWRSWENRRLRCLREGVVAFDRCAAHFPASSLADDASRAAAYWRGAVPHAFAR